MLNINIDEKLAYTLSVVSERDAITPELWIERKINALLNQHKIDNVVAVVKSDIDSYAPVIIAKQEEIAEVKRIEEENKIIDIPIENIATTTDAIIN